MTKIAGIMMLLVGISGLALAVPVGPEISPNTAGSALALLTGAALVIRSRRRK
jgi:hypothetical protein